jgi:hypothetical protein
MDALFNHDVLMGRWRQCTALARRTWAEFRGDRLLGTRSNREFACGEMQARYGRSRALIELRVRELERAI